PPWPPPPPPPPSSAPNPRPRHLPDGLRLAAGAPQDPRPRGAGVARGGDGGDTGRGGGRLLGARRRRLPASALRRFTQAIDPRYIEGMLAMLNKTDRVMFSHQVFDQLTKRLHDTILGAALSMVRCKLTCSLGENVQPVSSAKGLYLSWISFHISLMWLEGVVGWYRSNPGFYGRPSNHDAVFHKAFEQLNLRAILVAVDPVRSATGNFTMNAFRSVTSYHETSSNVGALNREYYSVAEDEKLFFELDIFAQGLASVFYSILISHRKNDLEINILKSMDKMGSKGSSSEDCSSLCQFPVMSESEKKNVEEMLIDLLTKYQNEEEMQESDAPENPPDAENHLEELKNLMSACILQIFGMMLAWSSF
uniref:Uncharacterized protein n=1 Tax=Oryza glaberrima TaxID=4538 RepID=I1Q7T0_ORYGL